MHMEPGTQHTAAAGHHMIQPWVTDHYPVDSFRRARAFEVSPGASEMPGVLIHVEQEHQAARQLVADQLVVGGDMREDRRAGLGGGRPAAAQPDSADLARE